MPKLIRDGIPDSMAVNGYVPELLIATGPQRRFWLLEKLSEEAKEAKDDNGSLGELGDLFELIRSIAEDGGHTMADVVAQADAKAAKSGRFEKGFVWINSEDQSSELQASRSAYQTSETSS